MGRSIDRYGTVLTKRSEPASPLEDKQKVRRMPMSDLSASEDVFVSHSKHVLS